jgi:hypothetical protein
MVSLLWRCGEASLYRQSLPRDYAMSRPQFDCAIVSSGGQGWPHFSRPPEGLVLDGREHDGTLAVSERKTTMRGSGASLVTTTIVAVPVPVPAVSTEVRELQSGSPSIIWI